MKHKFKIAHSKKVQYKNSATLNSVTTTSATITSATANIGTLK